MSQEDSNLIARLRRAAELETMRFEIIDLLDAHYKISDGSGVYDHELISAINKVVR